MWELRLICDSLIRVYTQIRLRRGGRWHRIAGWKAEILVRAGLAQWSE